MHHLNRTFAAAVLIAVLLVVAAPAAQALPSAKPQTSSRLTTGGDWLSAALSWLNHFFDRAPHSSGTQQKKDSSTTPTYPAGGSLGGPFNGSCIHPNGCVLGGGN
jgi:hypothetical protein